MTEQPTTLETFYQGWETYQGHLIKALAPLSREQLALRPAPELRSIGMNAAHIIGTRVGWFLKGIGECSEELVPLDDWDAEGAPERTAAELVDGLERTWEMIREALARWSADDLAQPFQRERWGQTYTFTRQW